MEGSPSSEKTEAAATAPKAAASVVEHPISNGGVRGSSPRGTTNPVIDVVEQIINDAIMQVAVNAAIGAAIAAQPWLGLPIIKQLFTWAVNLCFGQVNNYVQLAAAFTIIDAQTNAEAAAYQQARTNLANAIASGDQNAIAATRATFQQALSVLMHSDGK